MKIFPSSSINRLDAYTIENELSPTSVELINCYSQSVCYLAGVKEISRAEIPAALIPQEQMEKEMLVIAGITGNLFDQVLFTLRKAGTPVDYKAVLTEHNQNWNCIQLYKELEKEHQMYHPK